MQFISEWMRYANGAPGALARLKCDLEENGDPDRDQYWICEWEDAEKLKKKYCLMAHFKCSALDGSGVQVRSSCSLCLVRGVKNLFGSTGND
jgi:hypothetical protein